MENIRRIKRKVKNVDVVRIALLHKVHYLVAPIAVEYQKPLLFDVLWLHKGEEHLSKPF